MTSNPNHLVASKWRRFAGDLANLYPEEGGNWTDVPGISNPLEWLKAERMMIPGGWLGRRELFDKTGPWDESLSINQDGEYFTRAIAVSQGWSSNQKVGYSTEQASLDRCLNSIPRKPQVFSVLPQLRGGCDVLGNSHEVGTLISNKYQTFLYRVYPHVPDLRKAARKNSNLQENQLFSTMLQKAPLQNWCVGFWVGKHWCNCDSSSPRS